MKRMMAISLHQPWASLIAAGVKPYETRTWAPDGLVGQDIAIHAARYVDHLNRSFAQRILNSEVWQRVRATWGDIDALPPDLRGAFGAAVMPIGCIVCTVRLDAAFELGERVEGTAVPASHILRRVESKPRPECFTVKHDEWGHYAPGRWAWLLTNPVPIRPPVACKGKQRFFPLPAWLSIG